MAMPQPKPTPQSSKDAEGRFGMPTKKYTDNGSYDAAIRDEARRDALKAVMQGKRRHGKSVGKAPGFHIQPTPPPPGFVRPNVKYKTSNA